MQKNIQQVYQRFQEGHPVRKKAQMKIGKIQSKIVRYWILLNDDSMISSTVKLLGLLLDLLPGWMGIDYKNLN